MNDPPPYTPPNNRPHLTLAARAIARALDDLTLTDLERKQLRVIRNTLLRLSRAPSVEPYPWGHAGAPPPRDP